MSILEGPRADAQSGTKDSLVILLHGYMEHSGLYSRLIEYLLQQDWMVFSFDLPGHGLSSGEPYAIGDFSEYAATLVELLSTHQQQLPGPWVMIGQSTGAAVMMEQLLSYPDSGQDWPMVGRVLVSPLVRPAMLPVIRWKYSWFGWCLQRVRRSYGDSSGDQQFLDFIRYQDPLQYQWIPVSWVGAMLRWLDRVEQAKARDEQVLIVQGDKDSTLDWQYNLQLLKKIFPTQQLHTITGARHQLIQEESAHRDQVFSQIAEFLSRVPTGYQHAS